jgi:4-amino-4-deoxy-L-arabinose transferase-like glycosyltransferase
VTRPPRELFDPRVVLVLAAALTLARLAVNAWLDPLPLSGDEAQYWLYGEHLAGGYYSKPPLLPWLMRLSTELFGPTPWAMRLPSVLLHVAVAATLFALARALFDRATATLAALLYLTLPAVSVSSMLASTDPAMMLGWALAGVGLVHALGTGGTGWWALTGAGLGLGLLGKYTAIAWLPGAALLVLLDPHWRRGVRAGGVAIAAAAMLVVLAPNLVWNAANGFATVTHVGENADLAGPAPAVGERLAELADFGASQVGVFGPIPFAILVWLLVRPATWRDPAYRFVLVLGLPLLIAIAAQAYLNRANANWAAPVYLGFTVAVAAWLVAGARRRLARVTVGLHLVVFALVVGAGLMHRDAPSAFGAALDPFRKLRGTEGVVAAVAPVLDAHPDARLVMTDRMLMANVLAGTGWPLARAVMWNPSGEIGDHFELVTAFPAGGTGRYVVVTRGEAAPTLLDRFAAHRPLVVEPIATHTDRGFTLQVHLARDFLGYR